jgi:hypothetical protein
MDQLSMIELDERRLTDISGGFSLINVIVAPTINLNIINKLNLGILVLVHDNINKPISFTQNIL